MNEIICCPDATAVIPDFVELLGAKAIAEAASRTDACAFRQILPYYFYGECEVITAVDARIKLEHAAAMCLVEYTEKMRVVHEYLVEKGLFRLVFPTLHRNPKVSPLPSLTFEEIGGERMIYANFPAPLYFIQLTDREWR